MRESRAKRQRTQGSPVLATIVHFSDPASQPLESAEAAEMMRAARVAGIV